jgi:hypothetical protein
MQRATTGALELILAAKCNSLQRWSSPMVTVPEDADTLLTRDALAKKLTDFGYPVKAKTLSTKASRGGGPTYQLFGRKPLYRWGDGLDWAMGRLSKPIRSTSEIEAASIAVVDALTLSPSPPTATSPSGPAPKNLASMRPAPMPRSAARRNHSSSKRRK